MFTVCKVRKTGMSKDPLITRADNFAADAHIGQKRKYTGEPYINHPRAVARIVWDVTTDTNMIAAALLHDVIEDCGITADDIRAAFNDDIADLVVQLTDVSKPSAANRNARRAVQREHF